MSPLAIAHVLSSFGMGGQERVAFDLARTHARAGHRLIAISLAAPPPGVLADLFADKGIPTFSVGRSDKSGLDPGRAVRLAGLIAEHDIDIVHTHNPMPLIYAPLAARARRARVIHTKHGKNPSSWGNWALRRTMAPLLSHFVCVSEMTAEQARARHECAPSKLVVIPNGIDVDAYRAEPGVGLEIRRELGLPADAVVFGTVGRMDDNKNHALLVDAFAQLSDTSSRLVIVGDGPTRERIAERAHTRGLGERVVLTGLRRDVPRILAALDVFVLSSDSEGLPLVIPEAMAAGLPVVSTDVGGIAGVVASGDSGILVPARDVQALAGAMNGLARDTEKRRAMGELARRMASDNHSLGAMSARYLELYRDALG